MPMTAKQIPVVPIRARFYRAKLSSALLLMAMTLSLSSFALSDDLPVFYIYLAGPEVFLPEPVAAGDLAKQRIQQLNEANDWPFILKGLYPLDNEIENFAPDFATGMRIYEANIALMDKADFIAANMVRFRGPSMDVGTAFEMGYMAGLNKPVFAYYDAEPFYGQPEAPGLYMNRVSKYYPMSDDPGIDAEGQSVENFDMSDNLMMIGAINYFSIADSNPSTAASNPRTAASNAVADAKLSPRKDVAASLELAILQIAETIHTIRTIPQQ